MTAVAPTGVGLRDDRTPVRLAAGLAIASVLGGLLAGWLVADGKPIVVLGLFAAFLPVLLWKRPELGPTVLIAGGLTIEQFGYTVGPRSGAATTKIPLFHGMSGLHINPADMLLVVLFVIYLLKRERGAARSWPHSPTASSVKWLMVAVLYGLVLGKLHHGTLRFAFTEIRPYVYLAATFYLASVLITNRSALRTVLWAIILSVSFKAAQGLMLFLSVRKLAVRPDAVLGHEEALFFALFFLLVLSLWLFEVKGTLRRLPPGWCRSCSRATSPTRAEPPGSSSASAC